MRRLALAFAPVPVRTTDEHGLPGDFKEAIAFALLASARIDGIPGNLPSVTGAARRCSWARFADAERAVNRSIKGLRDSGLAQAAPGARLGCRSARDTTSSAGSQPCSCCSWPPAPRHWIRAGCLAMAACGRSSRGTASRSKYTQMGRMVFDAGDVNSAAGLFEQALLLDGERCGEAALGFGYALLRQDRPQEAGQVYARAFFLGRCAGALRLWRAMVALGRPETEFASI